MLKLGCEERVKSLAQRHSQSFHVCLYNVALSNFWIQVVTKLSAFRALRHRGVDACVIGVLVFFAAIEVAALSERERIPAGLTPVAEQSWSGEYPSVQRYINFVHSFHSTEDWQAELESIYAPDVKFVDSFTEIADRDALADYFANLREATDPMHLEVLDVLEGQQGIYLVWQMETQFDFFGEAKRVTSMGGTLFRLDEAGQIIMQRDFWDSTEGFFRHIPVLGTLIEMVRSRVAT